MPLSTPGLTNYEKKFLEDIEVENSEPNRVLLTLLIFFHAINFGYEEIASVSVDDGNNGVKVYKEEIVEIKNLIFENTFAEFKPFFDKYNLGFQCKKIIKTRVINSYLASKSSEEEIKNMIKIHVISLIIQGLEGEELLISYGFKLYQILDKSINSAKSLKNDQKGKEVLYNVFKNKSEKAWDELVIYCSSLKSFRTKSRYSKLALATLVGGLVGAPIIMAMGAVTAPLGVLAMFGGVVMTTYFQARHIKIEEGIPRNLIETHWDGTQTIFAAKARELMPRLVAVQKKPEDIEKIIMEKGQEDKVAKGKESEDSEEKRENSSAVTGEVIYRLISGTEEKPEAPLPKSKKRWRGDDDLGKEKGEIKGKVLEEDAVINIPNGKTHTKYHGELIQCAGTENYYLLICNWEKGKLSNLQEKKEKKELYPKFMEILRAGNIDTEVGDLQYNKMQCIDIEKHPFHPFVNVQRRLKSSPNKQEPKYFALQLDIEESGIIYGHVEKEEGKMGRTIIIVDTYEKFAPQKTVQIKNGPELTGRLVPCQDTGTYKNDFVLFCNKEPSDFAELKKTDKNQYAAQKKLALTGIIGGADEGKVVIKKINDEEKKTQAKLLENAFKKSPQHDNTEFFKSKVPHQGKEASGKTTKRGVGHRETAEVNGEEVKVIVFDSYLKMH